MSVHNHDQTKLQRPVTVTQKEPTVNFGQPGKETTRRSTREYIKHVQDHAAETKLKELWLQLAENEVEKTVPKAVEYGQQSLINLGTQLDLIRPDGKRSRTDAQRMELACWSYFNGKMQRWNDAVLQGKQVSDDTLFDIGVYVRMVQVIRATGNWVNQR